MLTLYYSPSCTSCRKANAWLEEHKIEFIPRNIFADPLTADELRGLLQLTDNGTEDLISQRSKVFQKLAIDLDELTMTQLLQLVQEHPSLLRRPMMSDGKRLLIGFNEEEIRVFLPRALKRLEQKESRLRAGF
jgi:regulatory protein spx